MKHYTMHVISNTHWDREWRHSFQRMRMDLVEMMDRLLDICRNEPDFKHYHLDSQTILLEDYLEIRPEKRALLARFIREGKILVGPWYTLPDMFLVSGEAIVRNLLRGHKVAGQLGGVMKAGYTPMSYGQISQIPQIYQGFDIDSILFYRGIDFYGIKKSEYLFEGADGSRVLGIKFSIMTRFNFRFNVFGGTLHREGDRMILFHPCDLDSYRETYSWMHTDALDIYNTDHIAEGIEKTKAELVPRATTEHLLMMDGFDASSPHPNTGKIVRDSRTLLADDKMLHTSFPKFIEAVKKSVNWKTLKVVRGERRTPAVDTFGTSLMPGILTSHIDFKLANDETQSLLEKYAEPISAMAWLLGCEYPATYLDLAWKHLLSNHGHDTICGASVDQIYVDALNRLDQARMIARGITHQNEYRILSRATQRDNHGQEQVLAVFNPLPDSRSETAETFVEFPQKDKVDTFRLEDFSGREIPHAVVSKEALYGVSESGDMLYNAYFVDRYKIAFRAEDIPSMGYKCFRVKGEKGKKSAQKGSLAGRGNSMENEFLKVSINRNGTLDLTDKAARRTYRGLHFFEDGGDAGNPWHFKRPKAKDRIVTTLKSKAATARVEDTPLSCVYRVEVPLQVPAALTKDKKRRLKKMKTVTLVSLLRLTRGSRRLEITTEIDSPVQDHRLRVMFPTAIKTATCYSEGNFDLLERPIQHPKGAEGWIDKEVGIQPQQSFVGLSDGKAGLAVLNRGLREYEVEDTPERTLAITLLRGHRYLKIAGGADPFADDTDQILCQCMGRFTHHYALYPHARGWQQGRVYAEARSFNVPLKMAQCTAGASVLKPEISFLQIRPEQLLLSAMKQSERGQSLILRLFNPTGRAIKGAITLANEIKKARYVNLNEEPRQPLKVRGRHCIDLVVPRKKIVTLELFVKTLKLA